MKNQIPPQQDENETVVYESTQALIETMDKLDMKMSKQSSSSSELAQASNKTTTCSILTVPSGNSSIPGINGLQLMFATPEFNGDHGMFDEFLFKLELCFEAHPSIFSTEKTKTLYTLSRLTGKAFQFIYPRFQTQRDLWVDNWKTLKQVLTVYFGQVVGSRSSYGAYDKIMKIQQGNRTVLDYSIEFHSLLSKTQWAKDEKNSISLFKKGLNDYIAEVMLFGSEQDSLEACIQTALRIEGKLKSCQQDNTTPSHKVRPKSMNKRHSHYLNIRQF